ncbi:MAG: RAD55 family ATPase [Candidatus Nanohaloarchaea archaeon]|nr:RAD55 family ATPase [Candidatus Nanohaloarchaea archaeon]
MVEREETGIEKLDEVLQGGLPKGATVLLVGPPASGKPVICSQFLNHGLEKSQAGLYMTMDLAPDEIIEDAADFGWDFEKHGEKFKIMDAYSWKLGEEVKGKYAVQGPSDLNQLNMTFTDAINDLEDVKKRIAINSISTLLLYTDPSSTSKFLQVVSAKSQAKDGVLLITVEEGVHDEKTMSMLEYPVDGVIQLKTEDDEKYFSVERMDKTDHGKGWHKFRIEENGIETVE